MSPTHPVSAGASLRQFESSLSEQFPYLGRIVERSMETFGPPWAERFDAELRACFGGDSRRVARAARGYAMFSLDAMRLQKKFEKTRRYEPKSYEQASAEVYLNRDYMLDLYLPGILLSHYLWPHHYRQLQFFHDRFVPRLDGLNVPEFFDVGVGTGFYSRNLLAALPGARGRGFDISEHSKAFAERLVAAGGFADRYRVTLADVTARLAGTARVVCSVEVIEHLEDPVRFLKALAGMLDPAGVGFITTALTAPNADHIYLYDDVGEVLEQLEEAGFETVELREEAAYEPRRNEPVPRVAAFIVRRRGGAS